MPRYLPTSIGDGTRYSFKSEMIIIGTQSEIITTDWHSAIIANGSNNNILVLGTVIGGAFTSGGLGTGNGIHTDSQYGPGDTIRIASGGIVGGSTGIWMGSGNNFIENNGEIFGSDTAIFSDGPLTLINNGLVSDGIYTNSTLVITNFGTIQTHDRIQASYGNDIVQNIGLIVGDIAFGAGNDTYDGHLGGRIIGTVYGHNGDDVFIGAEDQKERFEGGNGTDTLRIESIDGAVVYLDGRISGGSALGDTYRGIEKVVGSASGDDYIYGDYGDNILSGKGGNDTLKGGSGTDYLLGGYGKDSLSGGVGADSFVFNSKGEIGDKIIDFDGQEDIIRIQGSTFHGDLALGTLATTHFVSGTSKIAQDADDRFIFRLTDKTLWFDVDGTGHIAPKMIADLQQTAELTAANILIF